MPLETGSLLYNRYRIVAELGRGGMGAVYHARDENLGLDVAIKENLFVSPQFAQQFRREATLLASLRHPNLPRVTDHFVIPGQGQYLVMDFVAGDDAGERFKHANRPLLERDVVAWGADILAALQYLHTRQPPVVHRDIKPGNIKLTPEGRAVLVDFGLAKAQASAETTATGAKGLSPGYSPPEQYGSGHTDTRSDLYSIGATLYALLAGQKPVDGLDRALGQQSLIPLLKLNPLVTARVANAIEKAMAVQPDSRFETAAEFLAALQGDKRAAGSVALGTTQSLPKISPAVPAQPAPAPRRAPPLPPVPVAPVARSPQGPSAQPPAPPPSAAKPANAVVWPPSPLRPSRRGWYLLAVPVALLAAAGAFTGGGLLAVSIFSPRRTATPPVLVTTRAATATVAIQMPAATGTPLAMRTAPARTTAAPTPAAATNAVATRAPATATPSLTPVPAATDTPTPAVTPAGGASGQIAFVSERAGAPQIFVMDVDGAHLTQLTHESDGACQPAWSPDGQQFLFVSPCSGKRDSYPSSAIYLAKADGSGAHPFITLLGGAYDPAWSVSGIAFVHPDGNRPQIYTAQADGSGVTDISSAHAGDSQPSWSPDGQRLAFANLTRTGRPTIYWMFADGSFRPGFGNPDAITRDVDAAAPAWSPNNQFVAFVSGSAQIMIAEWNKYGFGLTALTSVGPNARPAWSPDGQWLVFESWRDGAQHDLYRMTFTGGQVTRLTQDEALDYQPAWRP